MSKGSLSGIAAALVLAACGGGGTKNVCASGEKQLSYADACAELTAAANDAGCVMDDGGTYCSVLGGPCSGAQYYCGGGIDACAANIAQCSSSLACAVNCGVVNQ